MDIVPQHTHCSALAQRRAVKSGNRLYRTVWKISKLLSQSI